MDKQHIILAVILIGILMSYLYYLSSKLSYEKLEHTRLSSQLKITDLERQQKERVIHEKDKIIGEKDVQLREKEKEIRELWNKKESIVGELVSNINQQDQQHRVIIVQRDQEFRELRSKHDMDIVDLRAEIERRTMDIEFKMKQCNRLVQGIVEFSKLLRVRGDNLLLQAAYEHMGSHVKEYSSSLSLEWWGSSSTASTSLPLPLPLPAPISPPSASPAPIAPPSASPSASPAPPSPALPPVPNSSDQLSQSIATRRIKRPILSKDAI